MLRHGSARIPLGLSVLAGLVILAGPGCDSQMAKDFREASRGQLESGVNSVVDGLLDGVFALWEPDSTAGGSTSSTTTGNP